MNEDTSKSSEGDLFNEIFNNTLDAILVTDDDGNYTQVNKAASELTGYSKKDLLSMSIWDITPSENKEAGKTIWKDFIAKGTLEGEYEIVNKKNERVLTDFKAVANIQPGKHISVLRDISETKNLQKQREETLEKLVDNLESISDGFFSLNSKMEITYFNNQAEKILGRKREEVLNKHIFDEAFPEAKDSIFEENYTKALNEKVQLTFEVNFGIAPYENWYSVRVFPTKEGIAVYFQTLTEEKNAKIELTRTNEFLDRVGEIAKVGGWEVDIEKGTVYWTKTTKMIHEVPLDYEPRLEDAINYFPGESGEKISAAVNRSIEKGEDYELELEFVTAKNNKLWVHTKGKSVFKDDKCIRLFGVFQDITDRKKADEERREMDERFRIAQDMSPDGFTILKPVRHANGNVIDFIWVYENEAVAKMNGTDPRKVVGKRLLDIFPRHRGTSLMKYYQQVAETGESLTFEESYSGETITKETWFRLVVVPMGENIAILAQDISERKKTEKELQKHRDHLESLVEERTRSLKAANKELEEFVYSVSHDLRAPLRAILGFSEIIGRRHKSDLNEEGQKYFDNIVQASHNMYSLIDDLLQYSRIGEKNLEKLQLRDTLHKTITELHDDLKKRNAEIVLPESNPEIISNKTLLHQIFLNIINNAVIYQEKGNKPKVEIKFEMEDENILIAIKDNGIGIEEHYQEKIFNIFQRLHSGDEYTGTGIGLAIVKKSVNILKGKLWLESEPGKGSTFFVQLPKLKEN